MRKRSLNKLDEIIIHCTDTPCTRDYSRFEIASMHIQRGFEDIGYHYLIHLDGELEVCRPICYVGAHCKGRNLYSVGVAYVGGRDERGNNCDTRTSCQRQSLLSLMDDLFYFYPSIHLVHGHHYWNHHKLCPCFDVESEYKDLFENLTNRFKY